MDIIIILSLLLPASLSTLFYRPGFIIVSFSSKWAFPASQPLSRLAVTSVDITIRLQKVQHAPVFGDVVGVAGAGQVEEAGARLVEWDGVVSALLEARTVWTVAANLDLPERLWARLDERLAFPAVKVHRVDVRARRIDRWIGWLI